MKIFTPKLICILVILSFAQISSAQKIKDFIKKTAQEVEAGVTDAVAKAVADKIVEKAIDKFSGRLDTLLESAFKTDSLSRAERGETVNYLDFLSGINESEKVAEEYTFDMGFETITTDDNGKQSMSIQYFRKDGKYFGIHSEGSLIVMDAENEILVTFNLEEKKGFAFGKSMMQAAGSMAYSKLYLDYEVEKTDEYKILLGYKCQKYIGRSAGYTFETYIASEFPINMHDAYTNVAGLFFNETVSESYKELNGMALESKTIMDDEIYMSEVIKVLKESYSIKKSDFDFSIE